MAGYTETQPLVTVRPPGKAPPLRQATPTLLVLPLNKDANILETQFMNNTTGHLHTGANADVLVPTLSLQSSLLPGSAHLSPLFLRGLAPS
jgi:hypothetical protein